MRSRDFNRALCVVSLVREGYSGTRFSEDSRHWAEVGFRCWKRRNNPRTRLEGPPLSRHARISTSKVILHPHSWLTQSSKCHPATLLQVGVHADIPNARRRQVFGDSTHLQRAEEPSHHHLALGQDLYCSVSHAVEPLIPGISTGR